jgi:hypothetical protein
MKKAKKRSPRKHGKKNLGGRGPAVSDTGQRELRIEWSPKPREYDIDQNLQAMQKVFEAGNEAGLYDALCLCDEHSVPLPAWAMKAVIERQREVLRGDYKRRARWRRQFLQDMTDYTRAEYVARAREEGVPWKNVFDEVSGSLKGTHCEGRPDAVAKSCKRFKRNLHANPHRFYVPRYLLLPEPRPHLRPEEVLS